MERATSWDRLFAPGRSWLGGDGVWSVPLERSAGTLFLFGDSLFRTPSGEIVLRRNTSGWLVGARPVRGRWNIPWPAGTGDLLGPSTETAWMWPLDGLVVAGTLHVFSLHVRPAPENPPGFAFETPGVSLTSFPEMWSEPGGGPRRRTFLFPFDREHPSVFGSAVLESRDGHTVRDGFITVYGYRNDADGGKHLLAGRVPEGVLLRPGRWRFWNGDGWASRRGSAVPLADRLSAEFSVTRLDDDRFVLIFQIDGIGPVTAFRTAPSPTGPFGPAKPLWRCPEARQAPEVYCTNAKAHPHLSRPGELLVSYNVNRTDTDDPSALLGLYRPRFLRVPLEMLER